MGLAPYGEDNYAREIVAESSSWTTRPGSVLNQHFSRSNRALEQGLT